MHPPAHPVPDMTYNVFGGTLSLTQSINPPPAHQVHPQAEQESILGHCLLCQEDLELELVVLDRL